MKKFALSLSFKDGHVTRNGWVKHLSETAESAEAVLIQAAKTVPGYIAHDRIIEVQPNPVEHGTYESTGVHFQLSCGDQSFETYFKRIEQL